MKPWAERRKNRGRYAALVATAHSHPKLAMAIREHVGAGSLWAMGLSYAADQGTDGMIPDFQIPRLLPRPEAECLAIAQVLIKYRLWEELQGGVMIHDWLEYNPTAAELAKKSEAASEAGKLGMMKRWGNRTPDSDRYSDRCPSEDNGRHNGTITTQTQTQTQKQKKVNTTSAGAEAVVSDSHLGGAGSTSRKQEQAAASPRSKVLTFKSNGQDLVSLGKYFDVWWKEYPKRASKCEADPQSRPYLEAWAEWRQINPDHLTAIAMLRAAKALDDSELYRFDGAVVLPPAEFLRCWQQAEVSGEALSDVIFRKVEAA